MVRPAGIALALTLTLAVTLALTLARAGPPAAPAGNGPTPWTTGTAPPPPRSPAEDSTLSLRVYGDLPEKGLLPYRPGPPRRDDPAYAVDVSAVMTRCADGTLVITALVIGGRVTPLENRCRADAGTSSTPPAPPCDASTWNCATRPPN